MTAWLEWRNDVARGPLGPSPFAVLFMGDGDPDAGMELVDEFNEANERAAGATFRAAYVHGASVSGNPRHQDPHYPPPRYLWPTTTPNA